MSEAVLLVGTKKGLWIGRSDERREHWEFGKPEFLMEGIYATCIDTRGESPRVFVSGHSEHWGPGVYRSDDLGRTWTETQGAAVRFQLGRALWARGDRRRARALAEQALAALAGDEEGTEIHRWLTTHR